MAGAFLTDDLPTFFSARDFGVDEGTVTWRGAHVTGVFDDKDVEVPNGEGVATIIPQPTFTSSSAQFAAIAEYDPMVVGGVDYIVRNWKHDGTGVIEIYLEKDNG